MINPRTIRKKMNIVSGSAEKDLEMAFKCSISEIHFFQTFEKFFRLKQSGLII